MTGLPPQPANLGEVEGLITREGPGVEIVNCVIIFPCVCVWFINYRSAVHRQTVRGLEVSGHHECDICDIQSDCAGTVMIFRRSSCHLPGQVLSNKISMLQHQLSDRC